MVSWSDTAEDRTRLSNDRVSSPRANRSPASAGGGVQLGERFEAGAEALAGVRQRLAEAPLSFARPQPARKRVAGDDKVHQLACRGYFVEVGWGPAEYRRASGY